MHHKKTKIILFVVLMAVLWLPFIQERTKWLPEAELKGAFKKPEKPEFSFDSLASFFFQKQFERYVNADFGFRSLAIGIKNSINFLLFRDLSVEDNLLGKNGFIFSKFSLSATFGNKYSKEKSDVLLNRIRFMKEGVEARGAHLVTIIAPSKEFIYPDFLPEHLQKSLIPCNYNALIKGCQENGIPLLDLCSYMKQLRDINRLPVFAKTSFHWSIFCASMAQDTLLAYMESVSKKAFPKYIRKGITASGTPIHPDEDYEPPLNLFFSLQDTGYIYPRLEMIPSSEKNFRPKVIVIGDSFFWQIRNQNMLRFIFSEDSKFWYYFAGTSFPMVEGGKETLLNQLNIMRELESADYVILLSNLGNMESFPFGVTDYYFEHVASPAIVAAIKDHIRYYPQDFQNMALKTATAIPAEDSLMEKARIICRDKKSITLKAANNKYLCAGGDGETEILANRDNALDWETFSVYKIGEDKVVLSSHKDLFVSADLGHQNEIVSTRNAIAAWEMFKLIDLGEGFVAIKSVNEKYLSLDPESGRILAIANSIGSNEKFKLIILNSPSYKVP